MTERDISALLAEQVDYYRERAPDYDRWWFRTGLYELPPDVKAKWDAEVARLEARVADLDMRGQVLELACGTGLWTRHLVRTAEHVTAVDASPETLAINAERTGGRGVTYVQADIFEWRPPARYDVVFFSFWLSHVPPARFAEFWANVRDALAPGGRAVFIDSYREDETWQPDPRPEGEFVQTRDDVASGREYRIVKLYYDPPTLAQQLRELGWDADVTTTGSSFLLGVARPGNER